jgi:hypothetical protein
VPDMGTLEDYLAVPVDGYGAALLRGMGWKEGEAVCRRRGEQAAAAAAPRVRNPRSALLGIGAKDEPLVGAAVGKDGKDVRKGKGSKKVVGEAYNPVVLRNAKTGEMVTEEELKAKLERQRKEEEQGFVFEREGRERSRERVKSKASSRHHRYLEGESRSDRDSRREERHRKYEERDSDAVERRDHKTKREYYDEDRGSRRDKYSRRDRSNDRYDTERDRRKHRSRRGEDDYYDGRDKDSYRRSRTYEQQKV